MKYCEPSRETEIRGEYDVIVCGSGPSGIAAAYNAGKRGASVLLIESQGSLGGISTSGMMSHFTGHCESRTYLDILDRMEKNGQYPCDWKQSIDTEILKLIYIDMMEEAHVTQLCYTLVCGVIMDKNAAKGVLVENKTGRGAYLGKVIIDATGDGDAAYKAGAAYFLGREDDHLMQPATLMFRIGGVDYDRAVFPGSFETLVETEKGELQALAKKLLPPPAGHVLLYKNPLPGVVTCNMTNITGIDGTKAEDLTKAEILCRSQMKPIVSFLREYVPGYENCYILSAASLIGIRETRHFYAVKTLTEADILEAKQFDDAVVFGAHFNFDVHNLTGASLDKTGCQHKFPQTKGYTIPYGCLIPRDIDGLLLSGRCIGGTHMAHSNYRAMPICVGIGEACGAAAYLAAKKDVMPRQVTAKEIQKELGY